jgi:kinesin family protein C1
VFSYGATGSGKTHTMEGGASEEQRGMIPRSVELIFQQIQAVARLGWSYRLQGTFVEIYNETLRDLLAPSDGPAVKIVHGKDGTTTLVDARTVAVQGPADIMEALAAAGRARSVGSTAANERSSRSHSVFSLSVRGRNTVTGADSTGVLHLVDLAGSERLAVSRAEGQRLKETQAINKSLAALSDVIAALANGEQHVPYRNSKLTYLLQNSLGGASSKTLMLVQISPLAQDVNESLCSLRFASKVNACEIGVARRGQGKITLQ